jgi:hypothetical protein
MADAGGDGLRAGSARQLLEESQKRSRSKSERYQGTLEVKGVALLIVNHPNGASEQWLWTPANDHERRVACRTVRDGSEPTSLLRISKSATSPSSITAPLEPRLWIAPRAGRSSRIPSRVSHRSICLHSYGSARTTTFLRESRITPRTSRSALSATATSGKQIISGPRA